MAENMARNLINTYDLAQLNAIIKQRPPKGGFFSRHFFAKDKRFYETTKIEMDIAYGTRKVAAYVGNGQQMKKMRKDGFQTMLIEIPQMKEHMPLTVEDLEKRGYGENPFSGRSMAERALELQAQQLEELADAIDRRKEVQAAEVLSTGKATIVGDGINQTIDLDFRNVIATDWGNSSTDIFADLENGVSISIKQGFHRPNTMVMDKTAWMKFRNNPSTKELYNRLNVNVSDARIKILDETARFVGYIAQLGVEMYVIEDWYLDDWTDPAKPIEKPMIPDGTAILLSTYMPMIDFNGANTILNQATGTFGTFGSELVVDVWTEKNPDIRYLGVLARNVKLPVNNRSWAVLSV